MKWFIPSWNGDIRVEPQGEGTLLRVFSPTAREVEVLEKLGARCLEEKWVESWRKRWGKEVSITIDAPFSTVGAIAAELMRPGAAVLTGITFANGRVETIEGPAPAAEVAEKVAEAAAEGAKAAVTVKRPTPCCPSCIPGAIEPASEVLLSFLSSEEHALWAAYRAIVVTGGLSGHRYLLSHRHAPLGRALGRICYDLDSRAIVHFHDWTVPPEEEVLAAKLILEHKEAWLRNEATLYQVWEKDRHLVFKNPFGDGGDGTLDATFCEGFGRGFAAVRGIKLPEDFLKTKVPEELWL